jgi:hypothetical protein
MFEDKQAIIDVMTLAGIVAAIFGLGVFVGAWMF